LSRYGTLSGKNLEVAKLSAKGMLSSLKNRTTELLSPLTATLVRFGLKPNHITFASLFFGIFASLFIAKAEIILAAIFLAFSGFMDMLDGALARSERKTTEFGGFLDSVFDRYVDVAIFVSLGIYGINWLLVALALSGALLVSYTRARAEKIIEKCDVGIAERSERMLILIVGLFSGFVWHAVAVIAILSHITALHRIFYTYFYVKE
jgi:archaetidylinositol phosphate synthase